MEKQKEYLNENINFNNFNIINTEKKLMFLDMSKICNHYDILEQKLDNLGSIKEILKNEYMLYAIIAYKNNLHLICALFNKVNAAIKEGILTDEDLEFFRSGKLIDAIINLDETTQIYGKRKSFPMERLNKINYISLINDLETLKVSYTHPAIINALSQKGVYDADFYDLTNFVSSGLYNNLPTEVKKEIFSKVSKEFNKKVLKK